MIRWVGSIAKQTVKRLLGAAGAAPGGASPDGGAAVAAAPAAHRAGLRVLVMGFTYKENVSDVRNTRVADIVHELASYNVLVDVIDPKADAAEVMEEYGIQLAASPRGKYDAVIFSCCSQGVQGYGCRRFVGLA